MEITRALWDKIKLYRQERKYAVIKYEKAPAKDFRTHT